MYYAAPPVMYQPRKKQKPVGIVITIVGLLGTIAGIAVMAYAGFFGVGSKMEQFAFPSAPNSQFTGDTATYDFDASKNTIFNVYVTEDDLADAACTAEYDSGHTTKIEPDTSDIDPSQTDINDRRYIMLGNSLILAEDGPGTISCTGLSEAMVVQGPIDGDVVWWGAGGIGGGLLVTFASAALMGLGILVMIIRALMR